MLKKLFYYFQKIKSSFWFVPIILISVGVILATLFVFVDSIVKIDSQRYFQHFFTLSADSARIVLSVIGGAMVGIAGTVFSITLVVLTLASSQFGPRLLRNFMYNRLNQIVLGIYLATFLYCLLVLNSVKDNADLVFIPSISVLFAIILAVVCVIYLVLFIHQISINIQPSHVIAAISREFEESIKDTFSASDGKKTKDEFEEELKRLKSKLFTVTNVRSKASGYIQYIDYESLINIAKEHDILMVLNFRAGKYLVKNDKIIGLYTEHVLEEKILDKIESLVVTANDKTMFQDSEFAIQQIVEIACKALSPGINDPFTAIASIDYLTSIISDLKEVEFPNKYMADEDNNLRILSHPLTYDGIIGAAFNQIRQYGADSPSVLIRLMEALVTIYTFSINNLQREILQKHMDMVLDSGRSAFKNKQDFNDLKERYDSAQSKKLNIK